MTNQQRLTLNKRVDNEMITNTNLVSLQGRLTADPETNDNIGLVSFSLAVDFAGNEKDADSKTGFFDVKMWVNDSQYQAPAVVNAVKQNIADGKLVKGAKVSVMGRLSQERWTKDGSKNSKVVIVAENVQVMWSGSNENTTATATAAPAKQAEFSITSF